MRARKRSSQSFPAYYPRAQVDTDEIYSKLGEPFVVETSTTYAARRAVDRQGNPGLTDDQIEDFGRRLRGGGVVEIDERGGRQ